MTDDHATPPTGDAEAVAGDGDTQVADRLPDGDVPAPATDVGAGAEGAAAVEADAADDGEPTQDAGADGVDGDEAPQDEAPDYEQLAVEDPRSPGELLRDLEQAGSERDEYLDALQRSRAEFDNFRKRSTREAASARSAGVGDLASQLLDVLDDLDRTADVAAQSDDSGLAGGIQAIHRKLVDVLRGVGVKRIDEAGVPFDATRHEAVQQVPAEEPVDEPEVAQILRPGYLHNDRVLRAAMVSVRQ